MTTAAFFDLDNTVIRGSSLFHFARRLTGNGFLSRRDLVRFAMREFRYVWSKTESKSTTSFVSNRALTLIAGFNAVEMENICKRVVPEFLNQVLIPETLERIRRHQGAGIETWLVTASPIEMAAPIAKSLGMSGAIATIPEIRDGAYTGFLSGVIMRGAMKAEAIRRLALERGINLEASYAYSDSINDLPMLAMVGKASVVNANKELKRIALKNKWGVIETNSYDPSHSLPSMLTDVLAHEAHPWTRSSIKAHADYLGVQQSKHY